MGKIIEFSGITLLDIDPDKVLEGAKDELEQVILAGYDKDGELYLASSSRDIGSNLLLLERFKMFLLETEVDQ